MIKSDSGDQIIDANGTVWTVVGGISYENGVSDNGGNITDLVYVNDIIYANTSSSGWWTHVSGNWQYIGGQSPGETAIPPANQIIDANGTLWTVTNGNSYQNGVADGGGDIAELLYWDDGKMYAKTNSSGWYIYWFGWQQTSDPTGGASSASPAPSPQPTSTAGTSIPPASQIVDASGTVWTVTNGNSYQNGVADGGGDIAELLYWSDGKMYAKTNSSGWYIYWYGWHQTSDPTGGAPSASPSPAPAPAPAPSPSTAGPRYSVGPQNIGCSGVTLNPGDNIQNAVNTYGPNTVFCLNPGTYYQQQIAPQNGDQFIGLLGAVLDGQNTAWNAFGSSASNVVIKNLYITNYANGLQFGSINAEGSYWLIQSNEISYSSGAGVSVDYGTGTQVIANYIHHHNQEGYHMAGPSNVLFDSNEIAYNNYLQAIDWGWEAGGGKAADSTNLVMQYNYSHDNWGPGLWTDIDNMNTTYQYNLVENNMTGIQHEISYNAYIAYNVTYHNGLPGYCPGWLWCSEIEISASGGINQGQIEIVGNSVASIAVGNNYANGGNGISLIQQNRGSGAYGAWITQNVYVHNNTIDLSSGGAMGIVQDENDNSIFTSRNNLYDYNTYILGSNVYSFTYMNGWLTFSGWQSYGMDVHSTAW